MATQWNWFGSTDYPRHPASMPQNYLQKFLYLENPLSRQNDEQTGGKRTLRGISEPPEVNRLLCCDFGVVLKRHFLPAYPQIWTELWEVSKPAESSGTWSQQSQNIPVNLQPGLSRTPIQRTERPACCEDQEQDSSSWFIIQTEKKKHCGEITYILTY